MIDARGDARQDQAHGMGDWRGGLQAAEQAERDAVFGRGEELAAGTNATDILYAEMDGVWLSLQGEEKRRTEARLGIFYTGKDALGKGRYALRDKVERGGVGRG